MKIHPAVWAGGGAVLLYMLFRNRNASAAIDSSYVPTSGGGYTPSAPASGQPTAVQQAVLNANAAAAAKEVQDLQNKQTDQAMTNLGGSGQPNISPEGVDWSGT